MKCYWQPHPNLWRNGGVELTTASNGRGIVMSDAPNKIWLEYTPHEQHLHLTDEFVWTGHLTEYVRSDHYDRVIATLIDCAEQLDDDDPDVRCMDNIVADKAHKLIAELRGE